MTGRNITRDAIHGHTLASLSTRAETAETKLARIAAICDASDSEGDITVHAVRAIIDGGAL